MNQNTKWKNLENRNPSPEDLRQIYVYHEYFNAKKVALIYPSDTFYKMGGDFHPSKDGELFKKSCSIIGIGIQSNVKIWQEEINKHIKLWIDAI
jgi:5-methylcytosine-specific restriction enzyme subunit McrC